jgi:hypothetical protein
VLEALKLPSVPQNDPKIMALIARFNNLRGSSFVKPSGETLLVPS